MENVIIVGSGPAGHTAAIYTARAQLRPLMFEGMLAGGVAAGGQLTTTTEVENFPGFPDGISGPALMDLMRQQSLKNGCRIITETVTRVELNARPLKVFAGNSVYETKALIIATGATARRMSVPGEDRLWQKGISACAVCDGGLPIFRNKVLAVIGGGDSAVEEATYLTKFAGKVYLIHRRDALRASKSMQARLLANKKIEVIWDTVLEEVVGEGLVSGIRIRNVKTGEVRLLEAQGLFYAIGFTPNTDFLKGQIDLDEQGYVILPGPTTETRVKGVFCCGDVHDKVYRQAISAAGSGCRAALDCERYLSHE